MNRVKTLALCSVSVLLAALAGAPRAQTSDGSYWNEYPRPAGTTNVRGIGSQVLVETPTDYHFFSGQHRRWTVHPVTAPTIVGFANKHCVFRDGTTVYGYSTFTGRVEALPTTGAATISIGSASSSWTAYVVDGVNVWAWSAFFGEWKPLTAASTPTMGIGSHMVTCDDGAGVHAFSAFFGDWVTLPRSGTVAATTWRNGAFAAFTAPDEIAAFSAYTNEWATTQAFPTSGLGFDARDAYASAYRNVGDDRLWFSAFRGTFTISSHANASTVLGPSVAVLTTASGDVYGYTPTFAALVPIPTLGPATVTVAQGSFGATAVIDDGNSLIGFSGLTGTAATAPFWMPTSLTVGDTEAFATGPGGLGFAYSAVRGEWAVAPTVAASATVANFECILRTVPGGYEAFSARTGTFATLASTGNPVMLTQGSIIGIVDATGIDVFDARYARWVRQDAPGGPTFGVHRLVGIGRDGANAFGFSMWSNVWETMPLQGTFASVNVNSSIGFVQTSSHVYCYTATGSMSTFARFPEFSRFHVLGQPLTHCNAGNPGAFVVGLFSITDSEQTTPFGVLRVDPNPVALALGFVPADGLLYSPIPTPDVPALRGITMFLQDVVLRPSGEISLSNGLAHYLW